MTSPADHLVATARAQLDRQERQLDAFRSIAGTALAAGAVVGGLLVNRLGDPSAAGLVFAALAGAAFAGVAYEALRALRPVDGWEYAQGLDSYAEWIRTHGDAADADGVFALGLAENLDHSRSRNMPKVASVADRVERAGVLLGAEVACALIAVLVA